MPMKQSSYGFLLLNWKLTWVFSSWWYDRIGHWRGTRVTLMWSVLMFTFAQMEIQIVNFAIVLSRPHWNFRRLNYFNFGILFEQQTMVQALVDHNVKLEVARALATWARRPPNLRNSYRAFVVVAVALWMAKNWFVTSTLPLTGCRITYAFGTDPGISRCGININEWWKTEFSSKLMMTTGLYLPNLSTRKPKVARKIVTQC